MTSTIDDFLSHVPNQHKKPFLLAYTVALTSSYGQFRHGSVIMDKKFPVVARPNTTKTHTKVLKFCAHASLHAEMNCILNLGYEKCEGNNLYVVRINNSKSVCSSKPCGSCHAMILESVSIGCFIPLEQTSTGKNFNS